MAETMIDRLVVQLGLDTTQFTRGQSDASMSLQKFEGQADKTGKTIQSSIGGGVGEAVEGVSRKFLGLFAILAGGRGMEQLFTQSVQVAAAMGRTAANIGLTTERLSALQNVAKQYGGTAEGMSSALTSVSQGVTGLQYGQPSAITNALQSFGISLSDANGNPRSPDDLLMAIADKFHGMSKQDALYMGTQMGFDPGTINVLDQGSAAINKETQGQASVTAEEAKSAQDVVAAQGRMQVSFDKLVNTATLKLEPAFEKMSTTLTDFLTGFQNSPVYKWFVQPPTPTNPGPAGPLNTAENYAAEAGAWLNKHLGLGKVSDIPAESDTLTKGMAKFIAAGMTKQGAAGMMSNSFGESRLDPNAETKPDKQGRTAYGLFQWRGDRKAALFAKYGPHPTADQQEQFAIDELKTQNPALWSLLTTTNQANVAGYAVDTQYERNGEGDSWKLTTALRSEAYSAGYGGKAPAGVPQSAQTVLNGLRGKAKTAPAIHIASITVNAKNATAADVPKHIAKRLSMLTAQANTGLS